MGFYYLYDTFFTGNAVITSDTAPLHACLYGQQQPCDIIGRCAVLFLRALNFSSPQLYITPVPVPGTWALYGDLIGYSYSYGLSKSTVSASYHFWCSRIFDRWARRLAGSCSEQQGHPA